MENKEKLKFISSNYSIVKLSNPYDVWIVDNFLREEDLLKIKDFWPDTESDSWHHGYRFINEKENILEKGMIAISNIEKIPQEISEYILSFHSNEMTDYISNLTEIKELISDKDMTWSGLRIMKPASFQAIHSDARRHPSKSLRKELTCLLYLTENFQIDHHTGFLELWDDNMVQCVHKIEPKYNRLVIFKNSDTSYHGVPEVNFLRKSITWSLLKEDSSPNRSKALFVARPFDSDYINHLGRERLTIKKERI